MQHLYLPDGQHLDPVDKAPYVASDDYRETTFLLYLDHTGKRQLFNSMASILHDADDIACFIQTWLVFSLLQMILGPFFKHEDYVKEEPSPSGETRLVVDTSLLSQAVGEHKISDEFERLTPSDTSKLFELLVSARYKFPSHERSRVFVMQALSVMAVARSVKGAGNNNSWWCFHDFKLSSLYPTDLELMVKQGWCPYQARRCWRMASSFETQMVLRTSIRDDGYDHTSCTSAACVNTDQVATSASLPVHCVSGCRCSHFVVNQHILRVVLLSGTFPLLRVDLDKTEKAQRFAVVPRLPSTPYIAISHVCSEGLGNPTDNSLPYCQLEQLALKVESLLRSETDLLPALPSPFSVTPGSTLFGRQLSFAKRRTSRRRGRFWIWLDTLCCPLSPPSCKALSLSRSRLIFGGAIRTLALSSSWQQIDAQGLDLFQLGLHVVHSAWMRRLWTFTEGTLSRHHLRFQFHQRVVSYSQLVEHIEGLIKIPTSVQWGLGREVFDELWLLRRFFDKHPAARRQPNFLTFIRTCVLFRDISAASDEAVCLALLANRHVLAKSVTCELGMVHFWRNCVARGFINSDVVFHHMKHLSSPGFRWAPCSLLPLSDRFSKDALPVTSLLPSLSLSRDGVIATSAAYFCALSERKRYVSRFASDMRTDSDSWVSAFERATNYWFKILLFRPTLTKLQDLSQEGAIAFLVHPERSHQGKFGMVDIVVGLIPRRQQTILHFSRLSNCLMWTFPPGVSAQIDRIINETQKVFQEIKADRQEWAATLFGCGLKTDDAQDVIEEKLERFVAEVNEGRYLEMERLPTDQKWLLD